MSNPRIKFTYQDYLLLPEEKRYELIGGELFMVPSPTEYHQRISLNLAFVLAKFVREKGLGSVYYAPLDVVLSPDDVVQPDILFISRERQGIITEKYIRAAPDLVIEIMSQASKERDTVLKKKLYAKYGVRELWLVDPEAKSIEVLTSTEAGLETWRVFTTDSLLRSPLLSGLTIDLREVF